ncbi:MAG: hypothetical protein R3A11_09565 [Bdellovibrionota bacterium]
MHDKVDHSIFFSLAVFFALSFSYLCYLLIPQSYWVGHHYGLVGITPEISQDQIENNIQSVALESIRMIYPPFDETHLICKKSLNSPTASCKAIAQNRSQRGAVEHVFSSVLPSTLGMIHRDIANERVDQLNQEIIDRSTDLSLLEIQLQDIDIDFYEVEEEVDREDRKLTNLKENLRLRQAQLSVMARLMEKGEENSFQTQLTQAHAQIEKLTPKIEEIETKIGPKQSQLKRYQEIEAKISETENSINDLESEMYQWKNVLGQESQEYLEDFRTFQLKKLPQTLEVVKNRNPFVLLWAFPLGFLMFCSVAIVLIPLIERKPASDPSSEATEVFLDPKE